MAVSHIKSDTIADFTGTFTGFNSQGSTTTIAATDVVRPSDWNSAHNQFYTLTGNTTGNSTASGTNVIFSGAGGISIGGSTGSIVISGPATFAASEFEPEIYGSTAVIPQSNGTMYFRPMYLNNNLDVNRIALFQQHTSQSGTTYSVSASVSSQTSTGMTGAWGQTGTFALFSRKNTDPTQADWSRILSFKSGTYSYGYGVSATVSWSTNASSCTGTVTTSGVGSFVSQIDTAGNITTTTSGSSSSTSFSSTSTNQNSFSTSFSQSHGSQLFSGVRPVFFPFASTVIGPGEYWLMNIQSTTSNQTNNTRFDRLCAQMDAGMIVYQTSNQGYLRHGDTAAEATTNFKWGVGSHSASSNSTTTIALTDISSLASNASHYFIVHGQTL